MQRAFDFIYGFLAFWWIAVMLMAGMDRLGIALEVLIYSISGMFVYSVLRVFDHYVERIKK